MSNLTLTKKEVAERQLNIAIQLFFRGEDPVSTHTLASAAHEILEVLTRGVRDFEIFLEASCIKSEKKQEFIKLFKKAENFFKHATKDASEALEFAPFQTEMILFDCVRMHMHLTGQKSAEVHVYNVWFVMRYPEYFNYSCDPNDPLFKMRELVLGAGIRVEDLKNFSDVIPLLKKSSNFPAVLPKSLATRKT